MIDRKALLSDLQALLKRLEADLLERSESAEVSDVVQSMLAEYDRAKQAERTAQNYEDWRSDAITQAAAAWVLSCVFVRFLEDNRLIDTPKIAGPKDRLQQARDEHELYFREHPSETDREYLLSVFDELAKLPGTKDVFGEHNPMRELPNWLSGDAAGELLRFFQKIDANTGDLIHDFTDADWDTRFLGDLYQDLSESARKKYALLQTPDFVEEFILDRTLEPALDEFGLTPETNPERQFKMIDPACGSGHFLLGAFPRILKRWQETEPGTNIRELVQRTLDSIHGVDVNPFAIAIARFRLLLATLAASGVRRLADAPAFEMNLACGDSLYHGVERQQTLGDWTDESHYFRTEDADNLRQILQEGTFHAVVANPPYITPKDKAANQAYRRLFSRTCRGRYALSVPFIERIFGLGVHGATKAAFTGQITSNSFIKAEFGKTVIEEFLPSIDLTHVVDTSGAYLPGHGVPTVILFGRNRFPISNELRVLRGIRGEPETPSMASEGKVWKEILGFIDAPGSVGDYVSVDEAPRRLFQRHPWSVGGGGAAELKAILDSSTGNLLEQQCESIGYMTITGEDSAYVSTPEACRRQKVRWRPFLDGESIRDWSIVPTSAVSYVYSSPPSTHGPVSLNECGLHRLFWSVRQTLRNRLFFGKTPEESGRSWHEYGFISQNRLRSVHSIYFAFIATHNHFVIHDGGTVVANRTAPLITFGDKSFNEMSTLCGVLNSSVPCFWMKQAGFNKGDSTDQHGARTIGDPAFNTYNFNSALLKKLPTPRSNPSQIAIQLVSLSKEQMRSSLSSIDFPSKAVLESLRDKLKVRANEMIRLQEDLDWECYRLYGLLEEDLTYPGESLGIQLGERAFEIVLARKMAAGEVATTWFERHRSQPITELPSHWPDDYKKLVQRRIDVIQSNPQIALIEKPEYKRRWNTEPWESQVERALKSWLLNRLESYFDFDGRMNDDSKTTAKIEISLLSVAKLADIARQDEQFMEVAEVYRDDPAFDVPRLVEELIKGEHVPLLPSLRYKPTGLRKRQEWGKTWELQRQEDAFDSRTHLPTEDAQYLTEDQARDLKQREIGDIPVPPKYKSSDFISTGGARYWSLRGKLDVPKERWVSFPHCEGPDGTLVIAWAGYDHLQLARAISAYFVDIQERLGGRDDPRLVPLLACIIELLPWLKQWHHDIDADYNQRMDEVFEGFVTEEAKNLGMTIDEIKAWQPPKKKATRRKKATK